MSTEANKALVRRFFDAFARNDRDTLTTVMAPRMLAHLPAQADPATRDELLAIIQTWNSAFSDLQFMIEHQVAEEDMVANCLTLRGTHDREAFLGVAPAGKAVAVRVMTTERVRDGQIVERWVVFDLLELLQQLGESMPA